MSNLTRIQVFAAACFLLASQFTTASAGGFTVEVRNSEDVARVGELVSGGLPFPEGALKDPADVRVRDSGGRLVACQAHRLGISWPDGSVRWALVQFPASVPAGGKEGFRISVEPGTDMKPDIAVSVREEGGRVEVDSGPMRLVFDGRGAPAGSLSGFPARVETRDEGGSWRAVMEGPPAVRFIADREHITLEEFQATGLHPNTLWSFGLSGRWQHAEEAWKNPEHRGKIYNLYIQQGEPANWTPWHDWSGSIERGIDYSDYFSGPVNLEVEERGPVRAVIAFSSPGEGKEGEIGYNGRIYVTAGARRFRVELTVENYEEFTEVLAAGMSNMHITNTKHVREFQLGFRPSFAGERAVFGLDGRKEEAEAREARLFQHSEDGVVLLGGRSGPVRGARGDGWIEVSGGGNSLVFAHQYFWEIYPKALGYDADSGRVRMDLWPAEAPAPGFPLTPGRIRTYEFEIGIDSEPEKVSAAARMPLRPYPGAEYSSGSGACHPALSLEDEAFPGYAGYVRRTIDRWENQKLLYGDLDFGDQRGWSRYSVTSGYHGVANELFMFYLSSGDPEIFRLAESAAKHDIEIDRKHWGRYSGLHFKQHTRDQNHISARRMGSIAVWNFGDVDYYFLTGRRSVLPALEKTIQFLLNQGGVRTGAFGNDRATTLPFMHLGYMYEAVGDELGIADLYPEAYPLSEYPGRTDSIGVENSVVLIERMKMIVEHLNNIFENKAARLVPRHVAYAPEGFYRFWRLTGDERAREGIKASADFLYTHKALAVPTGTLIHAADGLRAHSHLAWRIFVDEVERPAARAYQATGERRYLEYAKGLLDWRLRAIGIAHHYHGFGSTIPTTLWVMREAGMTENDLGRPRLDIDYEKALEEMKAKAMECFDADLSTGAGRTIFSTGQMLAAETGRVLISLERYDEALKFMVPWQERGEGHELYSRVRGRYMDMINSFISRAESKKRGR